MQLPPVRRKYRGQLKYQLEFGSLEFFGVFGYDKVVDEVLYIAVDKRLKIVDGIVDAVVGDTALRIVVSAYFCRAVAGAHHGFTTRSDVVDIFLVFLIVDKRTKAAESTLLVLGLVAGFGTLDEYLL